MLVAGMGDHEAVPALLLAALPGALAGLALRAAHLTCRPRIVM